MESPANSHTYRMNAFAYLQIALFAIVYLYLYLDRRCGACGMRLLRRVEECHKGACLLHFMRLFGMFIVNLLKVILSLKQMLHFTSASSALVVVANILLKTALINEPESQSLKSTSLSR